MKRGDGRFIYSPTDLCTFMESPFASWMDRFHLEHPDRVTPDEVTEDQQIVMKKGIEHEAAFVESLTEEGHSVVEIPGAGDRIAETLAAMEDGTEVVYQAGLTHGEFEGFADFLARVNGDSELGPYHYEVWDTKLAKKAKPYYLIQLCCYADMLEHLQRRRPEYVRVVLGTGERRAFRTDDFFFYYGGLKSAFLQFMEDFDAENQPAPEPGVDHGKWQSHAEEYMERVDHLYRTASITKAQVKKLQACSVNTMSELATSKLSRVPGIQLDTLDRLREQAALQVASAGKDMPEYRVILPNMDDLHRGLGLLPPPSPLDVFFDMEGYPLVEGGLEYLFGATYLEDGARKFIDWWAHNPEEEKAALEGFVDWVYERWKEDPCMHVFHYAAYEATALRRLMGRYGTREAEVDHLLRNNVLVDLYTVVRQGVRVGEPSYSIKNMEHLYMEAREGDVTTSIDSVVFYERWLESDEPPDWREAPILEQIRDYNKDDCDSTHMLYEWLLERQRDSGIKYLRQDTLGVVEEAPEDTSAVAAERGELAAKLLARAESRTAESPDLARIDELLGHMVEFHRREAKPVFWAMYDRAEMTEEQLVEDINCLGGLVRTSERSVTIKKSTGFWYEFDKNQDTKLSEGKSVFCAHDIEVVPSIEELDKDRGRVLLKFGPKALTQAGGDPPARLSLIPDEYVRPEPIPTAVQAICEQWHQNEELPDCLRSFLFRERPKARDGGVGALVSEDEDAKDGAIRLINNMDRTTLCLQGPPGTGKTRTASEAIVSLLKTGKRIAVTSNSHKAIFNLLRGCGEENGGSLKCLKVGGGPDDPLFDECEGIEYEKSGTKAAPMVPDYDIIGGTAWLFSRSDLQGAFDYLFVDEAGQVSLANLVGMSRCAENVVLLGDQMQLAQPVQGSHPGDSGLSILDYYLEDHPTMPPDLGVFLGTSWRMHPSLCSFISEAVYEGRLRSGPGRENRVIVLDPENQGRVTKEAGLLFVPVDHEGNTQGSEEEAEVVNEIVHELLQREHTDLAGKSLGKLSLDEILVVTPFNMQRLILQDLLPDGARVGTVDKFQGQQAPVVIVSMCASDGTSSSRGIEFLFERNRLNVALSRASSLAIVVGHPGLAQTPCNTVDKIALVNFYCRIVKEGLAWRSEE